MTDRVEFTEEITFLPDGGSRHVRLKNGHVLKDETFKVSPIMFRREGPYWGLETALQHGVTNVTRRISGVSV